MKNCEIKIVTNTDGNETTVSYKGKVENNGDTLKIFYGDDVSSSVIYFFAQKAEIKRSGDYGLDLYLKEGQGSKGSLIMGSSVGSIDIITSKIRYSVLSSGFMALLHYKLCFSGEKQSIKVRISGKFLD